MRGLMEASVSVLSGIASAAVCRCCWLLPLLLSAAGLSYLML